MGSFEELTNVRIDRLIMSIGSGIANAQFDLDMTSLRIAELMSGKSKDSLIEFGGKKYSLLQLGFTPSFYQFVETLIEVKVSISTSNTHTSGGGSEVTTNASSVSANYASKYQYSAEGSSLVRTKLVPVPAPAILNERMRSLAAESGS